MKVLVVDDSASMRSLVERILTAHKYEVETADNGAQALDKYAKLKPDIVTLDLTMPIMDGYETLKRILAFDKDAKVIMLTFSEHHGALQRCLEKGAIGYITKSFTEEELVTGIINALGAGSDKNVVVLFSLVCKKIEDGIRKILNSDASVVLNQVEVIRLGVSTQILSPYLDVAQIRAVQIVEESTIEVPNSAVGYVSEIGGQQNGMLVSFMQKADLCTLFNISSTDSQRDTSDKPIEFFNMINMKVLSELANSTDLMLNYEPARLYNINDKNASYKKEITKAVIKIIIKQKTIPLEIQLWFSTGQIFRSRF